MILYGFIYIGMIPVSLIVWGGSILEYRIAKHQISLPAIEVFLDRLKFPLNQYFSLSSRFNYWRNSGLDPTKSLQHPDLSRSLNSARGFGGMVCIGILILVRELAFGFSWSAIFWIVLSIATVFYVQPWRFGESLEAIEEGLQRRG